MAKPMPVPTPPTPSEVDRFWRYVEKREDGCWIWKAALFTAGYGAFSLRGTTRRAHRVLYVWTNGEHGEETLDHLCGNRACVNPAHLEPRSIKENVLRGSGPTAKNAQKENSASGSELDYIDPRGWRSSRADRAAATARYREANRDKINAQRRAARVKVEYDMRPCQHCGRPYQPLRSTSRYCAERACVNARQRKNRDNRLGRP